MTKEGIPVGKLLGFISPGVDNNTWCSAAKYHGRKQRIQQPIKYWTKIITTLSSKVKEV